MRRSARLALAALALALAAPGVGETPPAPPPPAVLDALFSDGRHTEELLALALAKPLPAGEAFRIVEIGRDAHTSHHLVWIRDREQPHRHDRHDLFVVMLRGWGGMRLGDEERPVGEGSLLYVPRGAPHAFRNASAGVAVAYAVYAPAFDGKDRVPVD